MAFSDHLRLAKRACSLLLLLFCGLMVTSAYAVPWANNNNPCPEGEVVVEQPEAFYSSRRCYTHETCVNDSPLNGGGCWQGNNNGSCSCVSCGGANILATEPVLAGNYGLCGTTSLETWHRCKRCNVAWKCGEANCFSGQPSDNGTVCPDESYLHCHCIWYAPANSCYR